MMFGCAEEGTPEVTPEIIACRHDWQKCANNIDLMHNNFGAIEAKTACHMAADALAKYGTPEWGWLTFGWFTSGDDFPKTGVLRLADKNVKFSNVFGAMVHMTAICTYSLKTKEVESVTVDPQ
jgi:hypothetical protein